MTFPDHFSCWNRTSMLQLVPFKRCPLYRIKYFRTRLLTNDFTLKKSFWVNILHLTQDFGRNFIFQTNFVAKHFVETRLVVRYLWSGDYCCVTFCTQNQILYLKQDFSKTFTFETSFLVKHFVFDLWW